MMREPFAELLTPFFRKWWCSPIVEDTVKQAVSHFEPLPMRQSLPFP